MIPRVLRRIGWREPCWFVAGLALIVLMRRDLLGFEQQLAPVIVPAATGERIVTREFAATVAGFALARRYRVVDPDAYPADEKERVLKTPGVWMSVPVTIEMLHRPGFVGARLRTRDGLLYGANGTQRPKLRGINRSGEVLDPGLPVDATYFFEVPPERLPGAHLQLFPGSLPPKLDAVVDIDLGVDAATVAQAPEEREFRR